jgi:hypothetical protein
LGNRRIGINGVVEKPHVLGLIKNVQMQGAQKPNREAYMEIR